MAAERALAGVGPGPPGDSLLAKHFTEPLLLRLVALHRQACSGGGRLPLIALNGPVGAGKSTLGRQLEALAASQGLHLVVASIDDLYRPLAERRARLAGNPFGVTRVPPGSHDIPLLLEALEHWRGGGMLRLPRFDKTLANGEGDRGGWREQPADALVLEGWLMGCSPLPPAALDGLPGSCATRDHHHIGNGPNPGSDVNGWAQLGLGTAAGPRLRRDEWAWLPRWNSELEAYRPLWRACDGLWLLRPWNWDSPRRWRFQAEARQRRSGGAWLRPDALGALVRSSLCSLPPALYQDPLLRNWQGVMPLLFSRGDNADPGGSAAAPARRTGVSESDNPRLDGALTENGAGPRDGLLQAPVLTRSDEFPWRDWNNGQARVNERVSDLPSACGDHIPPEKLLQPEQSHQGQNDLIPLGAVAVLDGRRRCRRVLLQSSLSEASSATG